MRTLSVVGARPQFVKAAIVSPALAACHIEDRLLHTGQHYDTKMSDAFFEELDIPEPTYTLGVGSGPHGQQTGSMLAGIEDAIVADKPDAVVVYGDTNSTLAGALAASKLHVPVVHVEAGLRSFNRRMPEEVNRVVADHVSTLLLAPTETAVAHLAAEGIVGPAVELVGDVMFDLAVRAVDGLDDADLLARLDLKRGFVLSTIHRAENTDDPSRMRAILEGLAMLTDDRQVVLPVHPRTRPLIESEAAAHTLTLIDPVGYLDMVRLERASSVIATDSGGVQKEAFFHRRPCVTLRDETEWIELVELGWNDVVSPTDPTTVANAIRNAIGSSGTEASPYGDGNAGAAIADAVARHLG